MIISSQAECTQVLWMPCTPVWKLNSDNQPNSDGDRNSLKGWIWKPTSTGDYPAMQHCHIYSSWLALLESVFRSGWQQWQGVWDNQKECRVGRFALLGFLRPPLRCTLWCGCHRSSWATLLEISVKGLSEGLKKIGTFGDICSSPSPTP
jgi:hypothetical protein